MDRKKANQLSKRIAELLKDLEDDNLKVVVKGGNYSPTSLIVRVEIAEIGSSGMVMNREAEDFQALAHRFGLSPDDLGKTFISGGDEFKIIGLKRRATKRPIIAEKDGQRFAFPARSVQFSLGKMSGS